MPKFLFDGGVEQFVKAGGGDPVPDGRGSLLLPSGAVMSATRTALFPPPTDPIECARRRREYYRLRRERTKADRDAVLRAMDAGEPFVWLANRYPLHSPATALDAVRVLFRLVERDTRILGEIDAELGDALASTRGA